MYASQTKRLCVRGAASEESPVQHLAPSQATIIQHQNHPTKALISRNLNQPSEANMTASAHSLTNNDNGTSLTSTTVLSPYRGECGFYVGPSSVVVANESTSSESAEHELINKLANETLQEIQLELLLNIRNLVTACNKKKDLVVCHPNFNRIVNLIDDDKLSSTIKTQLVLLICSVAKSGEHNVRILNGLFVDEKIFNLMFKTKEQYLIEACLRCLRSILSWSKVSRTWLLYESQAQPSQESASSLDKESPVKKTNLEKVVSYAQTSNSFIVQECIADIFGTTCSRSKDQTLLAKAKALSCIVQLIESSSDRVIIASLNWLTQMCLKNRTISSEVITLRCPSGVLVLERLLSLMQKDKCSELQFLSARCYAHIYRALRPHILRPDLLAEPIVVSQVLPTLIRMVHKDKPPHLRIKSAECIAYLIENETLLQSTASICDHLIDSLANMLDYEQETMFFEPKSQCQPPTLYKSNFPPDKASSYTNCSSQPPTLELITSKKDVSLEESKSEGSLELNQEMKRAAFLALSALGSNLESIRKKIFNTCSVMNHLVISLTESDPRTLRSVLTCMLSLSRSVHQLRTSFTESSVYSTLKTLLGTSSSDILVLVLAILCNVALDFSPGKQYFIDNKTIDAICNLTKRPEPVLKLHGVWVLMNMVYQTKDQELKLQILESMNITHVLNLLEEENEELVMKTLGFLRNLLSQESHIDTIMCSHSKQIMQSLLRILNKQFPNQIKEQCLCVLTNIAVGHEAKSFIMNNRVLLTYLTRVLGEEKTGNLRLAATCCITNLVHKKFDGSDERRVELRKYGIEEKLKYMMDSVDPILSDRVRTAYNQFSLGTNDKYVN